ncbi:MAG: HipA family kinase [Pseudomonadota bacterium]
MFRRGEVIRADERTTSGKSRPLRCAIEVDDGEQIEGYLKAPGFSQEYTLEAMTRELLATCLGRELGLPVCEACVVTYETELFSELCDANLLDAFNSLEGTPVFFSKSAGDGWHELPNDQKIPQNRLADALSIYVFDTIMENADRRVSNKNLLVKNDEFRIFDHEMAIPRAGLFILGPKPWQIGGIQNANVGDHQHALFARLKPKTKLDIPEALAPWRALQDADIERYTNLLPEGWSNTVAAGVRSYVNEALLNIDEMEKMLEGVLL